MAAVAVRLLLAGGPSSDWAVIEIRGMRVAMAVVVGVALSLGGVFLQCLMRNPLASPDLMGLASGAGLAVMGGEFLRRAHEGAGSHIATNSLLALVGSLLSLALVWGLARRQRVVEPVILILTGVVVGLICSASSMLLQHLMPGQGESTRRWLLGSLDDGAPPWALWTGAAVCVVLGGAAMKLSPQLDAMTLAEDEARSLGVNVPRVRLFLFVGAGLLSAVAVVLAGPVGFVGLVAPHVARLAGGPSHRWLILLAACAGAILMVGADAGVKMLDLSAGRLPLGVLTTFIGGPVLISMLRRGR